MSEMHGRGETMAMTAPVRSTLRGRGQRRGKRESPTAEGDEFTELSLQGRKVRSYGSMTAANGKDGGCPAPEKWRTVKPDGGWGWLVVLGVALSNMTTQSVTTVFGLLFMQRISDLGIDTSGVAFVVSLQKTIFNLSGLVTGPILKKFSTREVACAGTALFVAGLYLTGYANSLLSLICTYSFLTGLGMGCLYPSTFVAIDSYFTTWRARAVGLSVTGTSIGQMLLPLLVGYLLDEFDFRGTILILSAVSSNGFVGAALYQPVEWHMKRRKVTEEEEKLREDGEDGDCRKQEEVKELGSKNPDGKEKRPWKWLRRMLATMDLDLLKDPVFFNLIIGLGAVFAANILFQMLIPFFLESVGYTRKDIAICMSVMSGADIVGRLIVPSITDIFKLRTKTVFFVGAGLSALSRSGLAWYSASTVQLYPTLVLSSLCGILRAALICNFNLCVSDETSPERLPSALGLFMVFRGLSVLIFGPMIGFIRDYTGSYTLCMHILSVLFLALPFFLWLIEFFALKRIRR